MVQVVNIPSWGVPSVRRRRECEIKIKITDDFDPEGVRWEVQRYISNAASFRGLAGFTDELARDGNWHRFAIRKPHLLDGFLESILPLAKSFQVIVLVNGARRFTGPRPVLAKPRLVA